MYSEHTRESAGTPAPCLIENVLTQVFQEEGLVSIEISFECGVKCYTICFLTEDLFPVMDSLVLAHEQSCVGSTQLNMGSKPDSGLES